MKKRITALLLCLVMALSLIPTTVWAKQETRTIEKVQYYNSKGELITLKGEGKTINVSSNAPYIGAFTVDSNPQTYHASAPAGTAAYYMISDSKSNKIPKKYVPGQFTGDPNTLTGYFNASIYMVIYYADPPEPEVEKQTVRYQVEYRDANNNVIKYSNTSSSEYECQNTNKSHNATDQRSHQIKTSDLKTIYDNVYIDSGYTKIGWSKIQKGYASGFTSSTEYFEKNQLIYIIAKSNAPVTPGKPSENDVINATNGLVKVLCTAENNAEKATSSLLAGTITIGDVQGNSTSGYTCTVSINNDAASIGKYVILAGSGHSAATGHDLDIVFAYNTTTKTWAPKAGDTATIYVQCTPQLDPPAAPTENTFNANGKQVTVICDTENSGHNSQAFPLEYAGLQFNGTVTPVTDGSGNTTGYTYTATVNGTYYADKYTPSSVTHTFNANGANQLSVTLTYDKESQKWLAQNDAEVHTTCTKTIPAFVPENFFTGDVLVKVVDQSGAHVDKEFTGWNSTRCTATKLDEKTYTISIDGTEYINDYKGQYGADHKTVGATSATLTVVYDDTDGWKLQDTIPVTFTVTCEPDLPTENNISAPDGFVVFDCVDVNTHDKQYSAADVAQGFELAGNPTYDQNSGKWTCTINVNLSKYQAKYEADVTEVTHPITLPSGQVTLTWNETSKMWESADLPITITVTCKPAKPTDLTGIAGVKVDCVATTQVKPAHDDVNTYDFINGTYDVSEPRYDAVRNLWYCAVTITNKGAYTPGYDRDLETQHSQKYLHEVKVEGAVAAPTAKLIYTANGWALDGSEYATINVVCRPALPTIPELNQMGVDVKVSCTTKDSKHNDKTYDDLKDTDVVTGTITRDANGDYTCVLSLNDDTAKAYVTDYSSAANTNKDHTMQTNGTITLVWGATGWEVQGTKTLAITATCTTGGGTTPPGGNNIGPAKNPYIKDEPKTVKSGKTFDAGIALYVGLGILSLTGSAVAIRKREDI